jgi:hypothetical protein
MLRNGCPEYLPALVVAWKEYEARNEIGRKDEYL